MREDHERVRAARGVDGCVDQGMPADDDRRRADLDGRVLQGHVVLDGLVHALRVAHRVPARHPNRPLALAGRDHELAVTDRGGAANAKRYIGLGPFHRHRIVAAPLAPEREERDGQRCDQPR